MEDTGLQTRSMAVLALLRRGATWGGLGALVGALLGYLLAGRTLAAALNGVNWAGLALGAFAGCLVLGHSKSRNIDAFEISRWRGPEGKPSRPPRPTPGPRFSPRSSPVVSAP